MSSLLTLLREHEGAVEADLSRYHGIDYRDRWRFDVEGRRRLTLRMIRVRVTHLPPDSAVHKALGGPGWSVNDYLTADVFHANSGKPHPARPSGKSAVVESPERRRKVRDARRRARARRKAIERGEI